MDETQLETIIQVLQSHRDAAAQCWYEAIASTGFASASRAEVQAHFVEMTGRFIAALSAEPFDPHAGHEIGQALAGLRYTKPQALAGTHKALAQQLTANLSADQLQFIFPRLAALLAELSGGFAARSSQTLLAEQEQIRQALTLELARTVGELDRHRLHLEESVHQRTAELMRANEQLAQQIVERKQAEAERERRLRETLLLNHVVAAASSALETDAVMTLVCEELAIAFNLPQTAFALLDDDARVLRVTAEYCAVGRPSALGTVIPVEGNLATQFVLEQRKPLMVPYAQTDPRQAIIHHLEKWRGTVSLLIVPVLVRDAVIGTLGLDATEYREFTDEEIGLAQSVAAAAGRALENARLHAALEQELAERRRAQEALGAAQARLHHLLTSTPAVIYSCKPAEGYPPIFVSENIRALLGYEPDELIQNPSMWHERIHPEDRDQALPNVETLIRDGQTIVEFRFKRKDGSFLWLHDEARLVRDADGSPLELVGYIIDITERRLVEQVLERHNRDLALLNRVGQTLTSTLELQEVLDQVLHAIRESTGAESSSVWLWDLAQPGWLVCKAASHPGLTHSLVNMRLGPGQGIAGWVAAHGESAIVPRVTDDSRFASDVDSQTGFRTMSLIAVPLVVREAVIGVLEVVNKLSGDFGAEDRALVETLAAWAAIAIDNARLVDALRQQTAELQARNEELDAFAHTVAHDLKNPLANLIGYADVLKEDYAGLSDVEREKCFHFIAYSSRKMHNIIDELLLLAGVRRTEVVVKPLDMGAIEAEAEQRLAYLIQECKAQILRPPAWPVALGHAPWVEEVWVNYLSNALKYGGRPACVEVGGETLPDGSVRFWIRDNGPGLTPEQQERMFTPFTQLAQVRATGHGLGLSIVRRIVEKLGGRVGVESRPGQGSLFSFTLPGAPPQNPA